MKEFSKCVTYGVDFKLFQEGDCCDSKEQILKLKFADGGGGTYPVLSTNRWASDNTNELSDLIKIFEDGISLINKRLIEFNKKSNNNEVYGIEDDKSTDVKIPEIKENDSQKKILIEKLINQFKWSGNPQATPLGKFCTYNNQFSFFTISKLEEELSLVWKGMENDFILTGKVKAENIEKSINAIGEFMDEVEKQNAFIDINLKKYFRIILLEASYKDLNSKLNKIQNNKKYLDEANISIEEIIEKPTKINNILNLFRFSNNAEYRDSQSLGVVEKAFSDLGEAFKVELKIHKNNFYKENDFYKDYLYRGRDISVDWESYFQENDIESVDSCLEEMLLFFEAIIKNKSAIDFDLKENFTKLLFEYEPEQLDNLEEWIKNLIIETNTLKEKK